MAKSVNNFDFIDVFLEKFSGNLLIFVDSYQFILDGFYSFFLTAVRIVHFIHFLYFRNLGNSAIFSEVSRVTKEITSPVLNYIIVLLKLHSISEKLYFFPNHIGFTISLFLLSFVFIIIKILIIVRTDTYVYFIFF